MKSAIAQVGLLPLLPLLAGCQFLFPTPIDQHSGTGEPSQAVRAVGATYTEGEEIRVELLLDGVVAGKGALQVGKKCTADGKIVLPVSAQGGSSGFLSVFATADAETFGLVDTDTGSAFESQWDVTVGDKHSVLETDYAVGGYRFHQVREEPDKKPKHVRRHVTLPTEQVPHDGHSLLGYLRRWEPTPGTRGHVFATVGRSLYRAELVFVGPDSILTEDGSVAALRIDGTASRINERTLKPTGRGDRPFSLWVAADDTRTPLRLVVETDVVKVTLNTLERKVVSVAEGPLAACEKRVNRAELDKAKKRKPAGSPQPAAKPAAAPKSGQPPKAAGPELKNASPKFKLRLLRLKPEENDDD